MGGLAGAGAGCCRKSPTGFRPASGRPLADFRPASGRPPAAPLAGLRPASGRSAPFAIYWTPLIFQWISIKKRGCPLCWLGEENAIPDWIKHALQSSGSEHCNAFFCGRMFKPISLNDIFKIPSGASNVTCRFKTFQRFFPWDRTQTNLTE